MSGDAFDAVLGVAHLYEQRRVVAAVLDTAVRALWRSRKQPAVSAPLTLPGPELSARMSAPSAALVRDYARFVGAPADAASGPAAVPAHMVSQWMFPLAARCLRAVPYPLARILNAGCRLEINAAVPVASPLTVRARLMAVEDDGRRALIHQRIATDTPSQSDALVVDLYAVAVHGGQEPRGSGRARRDGPGGAPDGGMVPLDAEELARFHFGPRAGLAFACLTGDFNPVHWSHPFARAAGFATPIVHGFAMMARAMEGLGRARFLGATDHIRVLDVKFKRPLLLGSGADVGLYSDPREPHRFYLATAPGSRAHMLGRFEPRGSRSDTAPYPRDAIRQPATPSGLTNGHAHGARPAPAGETHA